MFCGKCGRIWNVLTLVSIYECTNKTTVCNSHSLAATGSWNVLETFLDGCSPPKARCGHASTSNDNIMYIHGGRPRVGSSFISIFTAELLSFDMATLTWKEVTPNYRQPGGFCGIPLPENYMHLLRDHHSLEHVDGRLIMFGGRGSYTDSAFAAVLVESLLGNGILCLLE